MAHGTDIRIPDSKFARELTELVRDTTTELLFHHSSRVYLWGALTAQRRGLSLDPEILYTGAMFHDIGLTPSYRASKLRFEVDGANAAREFLRQHGYPEAALEIVWDSVALHTTPGVPEHKKPEVAMLTAGVEMDVLGIAYHEFSEEQRAAVTRLHPRGDDFKNGIMRAFDNGMKHRPDTTWGTMNADVLARFDPSFRRLDFCEAILRSDWST